MSGDLTTALDRPYTQDPETRAAAVRRVRREAQADLLLAMLGLDDAAADRLVDEVLAPEPTALTVSPAAAAPTGGYRIVNGRTVCAVCGRRTRFDGICRQRRCPVSEVTAEAERLRAEADESPAGETRDGLPHD